jgi:predicted enzyme related to lactoylglutathione lyase
MGWKIGEDNPMKYRIVETDSDGSGTGGGIGPSQDDLHFVTVYAEVQDLESVFKEVEAAGGKTVMPPTEAPRMLTIAHFSDPAGNIARLVKSHSQAGILGLYDGD